jgi:5-methylthioadenosine/S-adenosylhomocysteine deaminase
VTGLPIKDGAVLARDGRIAEVGPAPELTLKYRQEAVTDFGDCVMIPGLINLHSHVELEDLSDIGPKETFIDWLTAVVARNRRLTPSDRLESARRGVRRLLAGGMTATADISRSGSGAAAMTEAGLHGVSFHEIVAVDEAGFSAAREDLSNRMSQAPAGPGRRIGISPHSPYALSAESIKNTIVLASRLNVPISIHVAESLAEVEMIKAGAGTLKSFFDGFIETGLPAAGTGLSPVAYLDALSALTGSTLAVHCVHVDENDIGILKSRDASVAVCPTSNAALGVGEAPIASLVRAGVRFGVGTDSAASNPSMDLFDDLRAVRDIAFRQSHGLIDITAERLLRLATVEAAEILGLGGEMGSLERGKRADMVVLRPPADRERDMMRGGRAAAVADWAAKDNIAATILGGEAVYKA